MAGLPIVIQSGLLAFFIDNPNNVREVYILNIDGHHRDENDSDGTAEVDK